MNDSPLSSVQIDGRAAFARSLLKVAAEVEAEELRLKSEIQQAAAAGDSTRVADIIARWMTRPVVEVLAGYMPASFAAPATTEPPMP